MTKDEALRDLWFRFVEQDNTPVCWQYTGEHAMGLSSHGIFVGAPTDDDRKLTQNKPEQVGDKPLLPLTSVNRFLPEAFLDSQYAPITVEQINESLVLLPVKTTPKGTHIPAGLWRCTEAGDVWLFDKTIPLVSFDISDIKPFGYMLSPWMAENIHALMTEHPEVKACLGKARLNNMLVIVLSGETSMLYLTLQARVQKHGIFPVVFEDGTEIVGDAWDDKECYFKKFIKKRKETMKGLTNPITGKKPEAKPEVAPAPAAEPAPAVAAETMPEPEEPKALVVDVPEDKVEEVTEEIKASMEDAVVSTESETQEAPEGSEAEQPAKRTRRKAAATQAGIAGSATKFLEDVSAAVDSVAVEQFDTAIEEVRTLRDIQIAVTRRIANITTELYKTAKTVGDKWTEIQRILR